LTRPRRGSDYHGSGQWPACPDWLCAEQSRRCGGALHAAQSAPGRGRWQRDPGGEVARMDGMPKPGRICSRPVWISYQGQRIALRWIALRLSQQQREAAERRKRRKACLHQQRMQADTLYLAGWVLLVTTLPREQWTGQQVLCLYQARWHIELGAETHQTVAPAAPPALHDGGHSPTDAHGAVTGMGLARRGKQCRAPGDA
jgi:hypothetical protein